MSEEAQPPHPPEPPATPPAEATPPPAEGDCPNHPGVKATIICSKCKKTFCVECKRQSGNRVYCSACKPKLGQGLNPRMRQTAAPQRTVLEVLLMTLATGVGLVMGGIVLLFAFFYMVCGRH
jgi:hypothetical protein